MFMTSPAAQYCLAGRMRLVGRRLESPALKRAGVIQKLRILECKNGLVLSNIHVPVSGT